MRCWLSVLVMLLLLGRLSAADATLWIGVYVWGRSDAKSPAFWMGRIRTEDLELLKGSKRDGFFQLTDVCWYKYDANDELVAIMDQEDSYEQGTMFFRYDRLDRFILLKGDPRRIKQQIDKKRESASTLTEDAL